MNIFVENAETIFFSVASLLIGYLIYRVIKTGCKFGYFNGTGNYTSIGSVKCNLDGAPRVKFEFFKIEGVDDKIGLVFTMTTLASYSAMPVKLTRQEAMELKDLIEKSLSEFN